MYYNKYISIKFYMQVNLITITFKLNLSVKVAVNYHNVTFYMLYKMCFICYI